MKKLLSSVVGFSVALVALAGCGAPQALTQVAATRAQGFKIASRDVVAKFGHGLGWENKNATPIMNDLSPAPRLGFSVKDVTPGKKVDLRPLMSPVADQGQFGSCTGFAMTKGIAEFMELKGIRARGGDATKDFVPLSPAYLWYDERAYMGNEKIDTGANMFLGMNLLTMDGVCPESMFPYPTEEQQKNKLYCKYFLATGPGKDAQVAARQYRGGRLVQITKLSEIKDSLDQGYPCVFGFTVFSNIVEAATTGMIPMPSMQEDAVYGGHATVAVGYDDDKQVLILKNSWGTGFGDQGYLYMPYAFFNNELQLVADGWSIRDN